MNKPISPLEDPLANVVGYQLRRASLAILNDLSTKLEPLHLSISMASILMVIDRNPGAKLVDIGKCLDIKRANITPIINDLERKELLFRQVLGRAHALHLTEQGRQAVQKFEEIIAENEKSFFGELENGAAKQLLATFSSIREKGR